MEARAEVGSPEAGSSARLDLAKSWRALLKYRWLVLGVVVSVFTIVLAWNLRKPRIYQAQATLIIEPQAPNVLGGQHEVVELGSGSGSWMGIDYYNTQQRILKSWSLAQRVVQQFGLSRNPHLVGPVAPSTSEDVLLNHATAGVQSRVVVQPVKDSRVFGLAIQDTDPQFAADLANQVAEVFTEQNLTLKLDVTKDATRWVAERLDLAKEEVRQKEQALYEFKHKNNILSVALEDSQNMISNALLQFSKALTDTRRTKIDLESRRNAVELLLKSDALDAPPTPGGVAANTLDVVRTAFLEDRRKLSQLEQRYGPKHPEVLSARARMEASHADMEREAHKVIVSMDAEIRALTETESRYSREVDRLKHDALALNEKEVDYKRLLREASNAAELYTLLLKRHNESGLQQDNRANNIRILDKARVPSAPVSPNLKNVIVLGIALSLFLGIGLAFVLDLLDRTVKTQEDIEQVMGSPVLGFVPTVQEAGELANGARELYVLEHPTSTVAESCRVVRTNINFCSAARPLRSLVVTSSGPMEGKTMNVINLGIVMAQSGQRTIIVDTDMRRPRLHKLMKVANEKGLSNLILGDVRQEEVVKSTECPNLYVLPCGPHPPNPAELLQTEKFTGVVQQLMRSYDRVIFDSPPLLPVTDAAILSQVVDGTVVIVRAARTTRDALLRARRHLAAVNANIIGVVINDVDVRSSKYAGYYYYYNYNYFSKSTGTAPDVGAES
jgi:capsular exopolysaccharide synthesis family protein